MTTSVVSSQSIASVYPELVGLRALITGLSTAHGVDLARAFADHGGHLYLHMGEDSTEAEALLEVLAQSAQEVHATAQPIAGRQQAIWLAQTAAQKLSGLDLVINLVSMADTGLAPDASVQAIEDTVAGRLGSALEITRVAANRMRTTWTEGLILNILVVPPGGSQSDVALACIARSALASLTRVEAERAADAGVRINGIGPRDVLAPRATESVLRNEPDIAALALYLASRRGRELTGQVFDLDHVPAGCC